MQNTQSYEFEFGFEILPVHDLPELESSCPSNRETKRG